MKKYDLVIIGTGAGLNVLSGALHHGWQCAVVENSRFGGTCLTRGCIPSKVLVHPADVIREAQHAQRIGLAFAPPRVDWAAIEARMRSQIAESEEIEASLDAVQGVDVYKGTGAFTGKMTMQVKSDSGEYEPFKGERFVIAAGARSFVPPIRGLEEAGYITSETFFGSAFPTKPWKRLAILGGGAIGAEFAHIFSAFGTEVTVVEMLPRLVAAEEEEVSALLERQFEADGIRVLTGHMAASASKTKAGKTLQVQNTQTGQQQTVECDEIFVAAGVHPNTDILEVKKAGIKTTAKGWIETNEFLETSVPGIWALGDINGKFQFRHKANMEADICASNILHAGHSHGKAAMDYSSVPWAVFTHPQIGHVGLTQAQAQAAGMKIMVGKKHYSSIAKGFAMGFGDGDPDDGFVKLIADEDMKIVGAHVAGPHAAVLVQSFVYLMNAGFSCTLKPDEAQDAPPFAGNACMEAGTFDPIFRSMVIHPSLGELVGWVVFSMEWAQPTDE